LSDREFLAFVTGSEELRHRVQVQDLQYDSDIPVVVRIWKGEDVFEETSLLIFNQM
jgi:hypothetical protein